LKDVACLTKQSCYVKSKITEFHLHDKIQMKESNQKKNALSPETELVQGLRQRKPEIPVVFCTAHVGAGVTFERLLNL
jgi:hypothetical protein